MGWKQITIGECKSLHLRGISVDIGAQLGRRLEGGLGTDEMVVICCANIEHTLRCVCVVQHLVGKRLVTPFPFSIPLGL